MLTARRTIRTSSGATMKAPLGDHYYRCNGRQFARGLYGDKGKLCPAKNINGDYTERLVWADVEAFLRNPGEILERLGKRLELDSAVRQRHEKGGCWSRNPASGTGCW